MSQFGDESVRRGTAPFQEGLCEKRAASGRETLASQAGRRAAPLPRLYSYANEQNSRQRSSARRIDVVGAPLRPRRASPAAHSPTHPETAIPLAARACG